MCEENSGYFLLGDKLEVLECGGRYHVCYKWNKAPQMPSISPAVTKKDRSGKYLWFRIDNVRILYYGHEASLFHLKIVWFKCT